MGGRRGRAGGRHDCDSMNIIVDCVLMKEILECSDLWNSLGCLIEGDCGDVNTYNDCAT